MAEPFRIRDCGFEIPDAGEKKKAMLRHRAKNPIKTGVSARLLLETGYDARPSVKPSRKTAYGVLVFPLVFRPMAGLRKKGHT